MEHCSSSVDLNGHESSTPMIVIFDSINRQPWFELVLIRLMCCQGNVVYVGGVHQIHGLGRASRLTKIPF
jgi:hypothetical protein